MSTPPPSFRGRGGHRSSAASKTPFGQGGIWASAIERDHITQMTLANAAELHEGHVF